MNPVLDRIERELLAAVARRTALRAARRRALLAATVAGGLLLLGSVASAVTGVGPVGGLFRDDGSISTGPQPVPGSPRVLVHAGGDGADGWDLLFYRGKPGRHYPAPVGFYCLSVTRSDARPVPREGFEEPPRPDEAIGASAGCEYPRTLAARVWERGVDLHSGGAPGGEPAPYFGLVLADAERVELTRGDETVEASLSEPVELRVPRLPLRVRRQFESREQVRATAGVPATLRVRAFIALLESVETPPGERTPVVVARAEMANGAMRSDRQGGRRVPAPPVDPPALETTPSSGQPALRLAGTGADGARWRAIAFRTAGGGLCAGAAKAPRPAHRGDLSCASPAPRLAAGVAKRGISSDIATGRRDGRPPTGSYVQYGIVSADVRRVAFPRRRAATIVARLSKRPMTVGTHRIRLFLAVIPREARDLLPVLTYDDGRRVRPYHR